MKGDVLLVTMRNDYDTERAKLVIQTLLADRDAKVSVRVIPKYRATQLSQYK